MLDLRTSYNQERGLKDDHHHQSTSKLLSLPVNYGKVTILFGPTIIIL